jgi:hypothetical protein
MYAIVSDRSVGALKFRSWPVLLLFVPFPLHASCVQRVAAKLWSVLQISFLRRMKFFFHDLAPSAAKRKFERLTGRGGTCRLQITLAAGMWALLLAVTSTELRAADGVFARFQLIEADGEAVRKLGQAPRDQQNFPEGRGVGSEPVPFSHSPGASYFVRLGGYIHKSPWYLPRAVVPAGADRDAALRIPSGQWTPWIDIRQFAEGRLHGRMQRSGGVAELPNVTADFAVEPPAERLTIAIELATEPRDDRVVKRWRESLSGTLTSFLVSPDLARDADSLETAAEMTARRLAWAREATGGQRHSPAAIDRTDQFLGAAAA